MNFCQYNQNVKWQLKFSKQQVKYLPGLHFMHLYSRLQTWMTGLEKLGFLEHESPCSYNQVQENVVRLVISFSVWR